MKSYLYVSGPQHFSVNEDAAYEGYVWEGGPSLSVLSSILASSDTVKLSGADKSSFDV